MRLMKVFSRKVGDKKYHKFIVNIPEKIVKEARLKSGDELEVEVKNNKIIIYKKSKLVD